MKFIGLNWTRRWTILVPLAILWLCINACGQSTSSAETFIAGLYKAYQSPKGPDFLGAGADTIFTADLLSLIRKDKEQAEGEVGILDYDPICDCQDFDISKVQITIKETGKSKRDAVIRFTNSGSGVKLGFALKGDGKRWRIADIHSKSTPSLYKLLQTNLNASSKKK